MAQNILIFRRGSIGDAVVSLPALCAIREQYPESELRILTNTPIMGRAAQLESLFGRSDLISDYFVFPPGGGISLMQQTRKSIKTWSPHKLIYLSEPSRRMALAKEFLFFKSCGISSIEGMPFANALRQYQSKSSSLWESESERLLRVVGLSWPSTFGLDFEPSEENQAAKLIADAFDDIPHIALCVGGKLPDKDWGDSNWQMVLKSISEAYPALGLLLIGAEDESERSLSLAQNWQGPVLDLCGKTDPRVSALAMKKAEFYLGHDSGPMHLAALMKRRCIAIFSVRAKPGVWFPFGDNNHIFYPQEMRDQVSNKAGFRTAGSSILSIKSEDVIEACLSCMSALK